MWTVSRFRAKLFYWLPRLHGVYKSQCLEIICRRVDYFTDVYIELKSKGFLQMLSHRCASHPLIPLRHCCHTCMTATTSVLQLSGLCPGLPGWAGAKTNLDFTEARDNEWQWHQMGHMQICTSSQTDNRASTHHSVIYCWMSEAGYNDTFWLILVLCV